MGACITQRQLPLCFSVPIGTPNLLGRLNRIDSAERRIVPEIEIRNVLKQVTFGNYVRLNVPSPMGGFRMMLSTGISSHT